MVVLVAEGGIGVVTEIDIAIQPGGQAQFQGLTEHEGGDGELVVTAELGLGGRGIPGAPAVSLAILGEQGQTRHRDRRGKEGAHIHGCDLLLPVIADGRVERQPGSELERVVQADIVALVVVTAVLERRAVIGIAQGDPVGGGFGTTRCAQVVVCGIGRAEHGSEPIHLIVEHEVVHIGESSRPERTGLVVQVDVSTLVLLGELRVVIPDTGSVVVVLKRREHGISPLVQGHQGRKAADGLHRNGSVVVDLHLAGRSLLGGDQDDAARSA